MDYERSIKRYKRKLKRERAYHAHYQGQAERALYDLEILYDGINQAANRSAFIESFTRNSSNMRFIRPKAKKAFLHILGELETLRRSLPWVPGMLQGTVSSGPDYDKLVQYEKERAERTGK